MIVHLSKAIPSDELRRMAEALHAVAFEAPERHVLVTDSSIRTLNGQRNDWVEATFPFDSDIQLASRSYRDEVREIRLGDLRFGGRTGNMLLIGGPCAVESEEQLDSIASMISDLGLHALRAGAFKPRTSPYSFQGLGSEGLRLLALMRERYGLRIVTEVRDATHVDEVIDTADIVQIGAKAMYDQGILRRCGKADKPILIKRGFGSTLQEFVQAAEFVLSGGNEQVVLCERGIRTFETKTRFTLDLCGVAWLQENTNLPVIVDPSHAIGMRFGVPALARAATAMGVDGLLIETHPDPARARSDAAQQLYPDTFRSMHEELVKIADVVGRRVI